MGILATRLPTETCSEAVEVAYSQRKHAFLRLPDGGAYFGAVHAGQQHGFGVEVSATGRLYEGEFFAGQRLSRHCEMCAAVAHSGNQCKSTSCGLRQLKTWSVDEVQSWLRATGFAEFAVAFAQARVDGHRLLQLSHRELEIDFNILRYGERHQFLEAVSRQLQKLSAEELQNEAEEVLMIRTHHLQVGSSFLAGTFGDLCQRPALYLGKEVSFRKLRGESVTDRSRWRCALASLAELRHPGLVLLLGVVAHDSGFGVVSEHVEETLAISLDTWMRRDSPYQQPVPAPGPKSVLRVAIGLARVLRHLHQNSVWHLRLSPWCVFLHPGLLVKVGDYAVSSLEACMGKEEEEEEPGSSGSLSWPPALPVPLEVLRSPYFFPAASTDMYAFGVLLWQILHGEAFFFTELTPAQQVVAVAFAQQSLPALPQSPLASVAYACLCKDAADRPSIAKVLQEIETMEARADEEPVSVLPS